MGNKKLELRDLIGNDIIETYNMIMNGKDDNGKEILSNYITTYNTLESEKEEEDENESSVIEQARFFTREEAKEGHKKIVEYVKKHKNNLKDIDEFCYYLKGNIGDVDFEPEG